MPFMQASVFSYDSISVDTKNGRISFLYTTDAGHAFTHELTFPFPEGSDVKALSPAVFALGMAELAHYWKAILAPRIMVRAGALSPEQIAFWESFYTNGLGEFFFKNKIDFRDLVHVHSSPDAPSVRETESIPSSRALVPFGGGKDSLVSGEILKSLGKEFAWFELEPLPFAERLKQQTGVTTSVLMGRSVVKNFAPIVALVEEGAPNGHVPITATYALSAIVAGKALGYSDVILSIEQSASEGNTEYLGIEINHQYAKSFEFERALNAYVRRYIDSSMRVFSLLRPYHELSIIREFAKHPEYFDSFISCNKGLKTGTWCGQCAKCAFVYLGLSAFLPPPDVERIFGKNLFDDEALLPVFRDLVGLGAMKPFECVGTFRENMLALYLSGKKYEEAGMALPLALRGLPIERGAAELSLLEEVSHEHAVPPEYTYRL
jgi:7-cyano-7-deazaguanine synthase in queuosine biosynthesis